MPDEGFSGISLLHDRLYSDLMRPKLSLHIAYAPHIGIATGKDEWGAVKRVSGLERGRPARFRRGGAYSKSGSHERRE